MSGSDSVGPRFNRSDESRAFEAMWRGLPRKGQLPERRTFQPRLAKQFLRSLLLVQAPTPDDQSLHVRLVGDAISQEVLGNIVGRDYLDLIPERQRKARVLDIARAMFSQPCGVWWIAPMNYQRDYSRLWELTAFPLKGGSHIRAAILVHALPFDIVPNAGSTDQKAIQIGVAAQLELIPVGPAP